jgi:hypothetical protein
VCREKCPEKHKLSQLLQIAFGQSLNLTSQNDEVRTGRDSNRYDRIQMEISDSHIGRYRSRFCLQVKVDNVDFTVHLSSSFPKFDRDSEQNNSNQSRSRSGDRVR